MMKKTNVEATLPGGNVAFIIPDEAIDYIIRHYLEKRNAEGVPAVIGISTTTVETVLELFVRWAARNNYIKDGILTLGGYKVG